MSILKRTLKTSRDKMLANVMAELNSLRAQVNEVQHAQLEINHNHSMFLEQLDKRTKNSGAIYLSEREMATKLFSGLKIYVDPQDLTLGVHLALDSIWESDITAAWLQVVRPGDTVVDIGANYGYFGALAAQKIFDSEDCHFVFFEANPYLMPYIRRTLAANWLIDKCAIENYAITDKPGEVSLNVSPYYLGNASLSKVSGTTGYDPYRIHAEELEIKKVQAVSLDDYCKDHKIKSVDLIKMDIEGFEENAYQGMRKTIRNSPDVSMFIEFTKSGYKNPRKFFEQMLKDFGNVYTINSDGKITKVKNATYDAIVPKSKEWVMPIFSKRTDLASAR